MPGTVTVTQSNKQHPIEKVVFSWTSDAGGDADGTTVTVHGKLNRVVTNPGAGPPTANYDIVINDEDGFDVLGGLGANRHTTTTEEAIPFMSGTLTEHQRVVSGTLELVVSNAGNATSGTVTLYVER